jgi:type II secretory pathway pseudopilin PulG
LVGDTVTEPVPPPSGETSGITLLELIVVITIITVVAAFTLPIMRSMRARAQRVQCVVNLRNLHVAAAQYVQDNNQWPQIDSGSDDENDTGYAQQWITALVPYQVGKKNWICPTLQNVLGNPDYNSPGSERVDYFGMPFDDKPMTPYQWSRQPWFVEGADVHGHGQLIIFTDGGISDMKTVVAGTKH